VTTGGRVSFLSSSDRHAAAAAAAVLASCWMRCRHRSIAVTETESVRLDFSADGDREETPPRYAAAAHTAETSAQYSSL